jgi:hypothetical protein
VGTVLSQLAFTIAHFVLFVFVGWGRFDVVFVVNFVLGGHCASHLITTG